MQSCPTNEQHLKYALMDMDADEGHAYEQHILICEAALCSQTRREYWEEGDWAVQFRFAVPKDIIARVRNQHASNSDAQRNLPQR